MCQITLSATSKTGILVFILFTKLIKMKFNNSNFKIIPENVHTRSHCHSRGKDYLVIISGQ